LSAEALNFRLGLTRRKLPDSIQSPEAARLADFD
jgi:hypothetical protein